MPLTGRITHMGTETTVDPTFEVVNSNNPGPDIDYTKNGFDGQVRNSNSITSMTYGVPFWGDVPEAWDFIYFNHTRLPGIARIKGNVKRRKDPKSIPGKRGKKVTILGDDAAEVEIRVRLWTQQHLSDFSKLVRDLKVQLSRVAGTTGTRIADYPVVDVYHPALNLHGIVHLHVLEYSLLEPDGDDGIYSATIKCLEATDDEQRSKSGVGTPKTVTSSGSILDRGPGAIANKLTAQQSKPSVTNRGP